MGPILRALLRSKAAALLIVLEIALTLAIVSNALSIVVDRVGAMQRPTGVEEDRLVSLVTVAVDDQYDWAGAYTADYTRLRAIPGVENAYASNTLPLTNGGWSSSISWKRGERSETGAALYFSDENAAATLGLKLVAGRNFDAREISQFSRNNVMNPKVVVITQALANQMFPNGDAVGKFISIGANVDTLEQEIIGVVERLQTPWPRGGGFVNAEYSVLVPYRPEGFTRWVIRTAPGQQEAVLKTAEETLGKADRNRVILDPETFQQIRADGYRTYTTMVVIMSVISVLLLIITALGIVGMVSFWVTQRTRQIGARRALGARKRDILAHFRIENLLLSIGGIVIGVGLAFAVNYGFAQAFGAPRMPWFYLPIGALLVLLLGQLAVWVPAHRAAQIAPAIATRSA